MSFTLQQLKVFSSVAKTLNLRQTADQLFLTPPAVTKQLQNLELALGFDLLVRYKNRVSLSDKGERFYQKILPILQEINVLKEVEVPAIRESYTLVRFAMSHIFEQSLLSMLCRLKKVKKHLEVDVAVMSKKAQLNALKANKIDVAIVVLSDGELKALQKEDFQAFHYKAIVFHPYIARKLLLDDHQHILEASKRQKVLSGQKAVLIDSDVNLLPIPERNIRYMNSYLSIYNAIVSGLGYGFLPSNLIQNIAKDPSLYQLDEEISVKKPPVESYFVCLKGGRAKSIIQELIQLIMKKV